MSEFYNELNWENIGWQMPKIGDYCLYYNNKFKKIVIQNDGSIQKECFVLRRKNVS
jgi:hypothetical protein